MKHKMLLVDDDKVMLQLLKKIFEKEYTVFTACDGVEALHCLYNGIKPDVIVSDLIMENINGYEFVKHLSTSVVFSKIPVVILSSMAESEAMRMFPAVKTISKPFDPLKLLSYINTKVLSANTQIFSNN